MYLSRLSCRLTLQYLTVHVTRSGRMKILNEENWLGHQRCCGVFAKLTFQHLPLYVTRSGSMEILNYIHVN